MILIGFVSNLFARLSAHRAYVRTLRELTELTDQALADIGLHRGGLEDAARHGRR